MTATLPEPDLRAALRIETTVELIDLEGLGIIVAELNNHAQAEFLAGFVEAFSRFEDGSAGRGMQLAAIAQALQETGTARRVWELLHDLAEHVAEVVEL